MAKQENSGLEIIENADALKNKIGKAEGFIEKNNKLFMIGGGIILACLLAYYGYQYYQNSQEKEAQAAMYDAVFSFEADSLNQALKGQGGNEGLLAVADNYGSTKAGKLASLYAGIALMNQGKYKEAIERIEKFSSDDQVVQAKAYCLVGDCNMELKNTADAIKSYEKAVDYKANKFATPGYMMKLANAQLEAKNTKGAIETYTKLSDTYPFTNDGVLAKRNKARLQAEIGE